MIKLTILMALLLSGCANFSINGTMCDEIAQDPNAVVPEECKVYNEAKAKKAFDKVVQEKKVSDQDIEFHQED